jgi:hypothetical protein
LLRHALRRSVDVDLLQRKKSVTSPRKRFVFSPTCVRTRVARFFSVILTKTGGHYTK